MGTHLPDGWRYEGPAGLLRLPRTLVVNSAQSKTPVGADPWVGATAAAIRATAGRGDAVIASESPLPWGLALHCAIADGGPVLVVDPTGAAAGRSLLAEEYAAPYNRVGLLIPDGPSLPGKAGWRARDRAAWDLADRVVPIALRPGSRWTPLLDSAATVKTIDRSFTVPYSSGTWRSAVVEVPAVDTLDESRWLTHWTRRCHGPWPGEHAAEFFAALLASGSDYPRSAPATLRRILAEHLLRPSAFRSSGGIGVVSFTAATPAAIRANFRWCHRKVAPMWEPYGIAIDRDAARNAGIAPVTYGDSAGPAWLRHGGGPFTGEAEWRARGPLDLSSLDPMSWMAIVPSAHDAEAFAPESGSRAMSWETYCLSSSESPTLRGVYR